MKGKIARNDFTKRTFKSYFCFQLFCGGLVTLCGIMETIKNPGDDFPITLKMGICMLILSLSTAIMMKI